MEDITFYIVAMHELIYVFFFTLGTYVILCSYSIYNVQETFIEKNIACMEHLHTVHAELIDHIEGNVYRHGSGESGAIR
jgi:hypothetical protein